MDPLVDPDDYCAEDYDKLCVLDYKVKTREEEQKERRILAANKRRRRIPQSYKIWNVINNGIDVW